MADAYVVLTGGGWDGGGGPLVRLRTMGDMQGFVHAIVPASEG